MTDTPTNPTEDLNQKRDAFLRNLNLVMSFPDPIAGLVALHCGFTSIEEAKAAGVILTPHN